VEKQIVVIEDDDSTRDLMGMLIGHYLKELEIEGEIFSFSSASAYLCWQSKQDSPDLIISDVDMPPGMSGLELLEELRPGMSKTYYVIMSAEPLNQKPAMELGVDYFLSKPFKIKEIRGILEQIK